MLTHELLHQKKMNFRLQKSTFYFIEIIILALF